MVRKWRCCSTRLGIDSFNSFAVQIFFSETFELSWSWSGVVLLKTSKLFGLEKLPLNQPKWIGKPCFPSNKVGFCSSLFQISLTTIFLFWTSQNLTEFCLLGVKAVGFQLALEFFVRLIWKGLTESTCGVPRWWSSPSGSRCGRLCWQAKRVCKPWKMFQGQSLQDRKPPRRAAKEQSACNIEKLLSWTIQSSS